MLNSLFSTTFIMMIILSVPALADPTEVIVDDDFTGQSDVEGYNLSHGTSYTFGYDAFNNIPEAVSVPTVYIVNLLEGLYTEPLDFDYLSGYRPILILGEDSSKVTIMPATAIAFNNPMTSITAAGIRVVDDSVCFDQITFDFHDIRANNTAGLIYWNAEGSITNCVLKNMSVWDDHYEITSYFRAPDFDLSGPAEIYIAHCRFSNTGRIGVVTHDSVYAIIENNRFEKDLLDFGYAIEMGSTSSGTIRNNSFAGFRRVIEGSQVNWGSAAILIENTFTQNITTPVNKHVYLENNDITQCGTGIFIGNGVAGWAGPVHLYAHLNNNQIHHDTALGGSFSSAGIDITDEGADAGSQVSIDIDSCDIEYNDEYGIYIHANGNSNITTRLRYSNVLFNDYGLYVAGDPKDKDGLYNFDVHHNLFNNYAYNGTNYSGMKYWDDGDSVGNCWHDYVSDAYPSGWWYINGLPFPGAVDRYPNIYCGECSPGDATGNITIDILDISYLINQIYFDGPEPIPFSVCSGDPNTDCTINILDIVLLIDFVYGEGTPPGVAFDWLNNCGWPLQKKGNIKIDSDEPTISVRSHPYK